MLALRYDAVHENLTKYCDKIIDNNETVIITREADEKGNLLIISCKGHYED